MKRPQRLGKIRVNYYRSVYVYELFFKENIFKDYNESVPHRAAIQKYAYILIKFILRRSHKKMLAVIILG